VIGQKVVCKQVFDLPQLLLGKALLGKALFGRTGDRTSVPTKNQNEKSNGYK
jgi:hypothetical protein